MLFKKMIKLLVLGLIVVGGGIGGSANAAYIKNIEFDLTQESAGEPSVDDDYVMDITLKTKIADIDISSERSDGKTKMSSNILTAETNFATCPLKSLMSGNIGLFLADGISFEYRKKSKYNMEEFYVYKNVLCYPCKPYDIFKLRMANKWIRGVYTGFPFLGAVMDCDPAWEYINMPDMSTLVTYDTNFADSHIFRFKIAYFYPLNEKKSVSMGPSYEIQRSEQTDYKKIMIRIKIDFEK